MTRIINTTKQLKAFKKSCKKKNKIINFVPTMGSLHKGHEELIKKAKKRNGICVTSIFVNPLQFSEKNDYLNYPKNNNQDLKILEDLAVDYLILLNEEEFLGPSFSSLIINKKPHNSLCEIDRPGHFEGVATVIAKFLISLNPDFLYLGEKDFQQILIIEKLIRDFNFDTRVIRVKIVREKDGLAFSSRNKLLIERNRKIAPFLFKSLSFLRDRILKSNFEIDEIKDVKIKLIKEGFEFVNYLEIRKERNLAIIDDVPSKCRVFSSVGLNNIRLIDNLFIGKLSVSNGKINNFN